MHCDDKILWYTYLESNCNFGHFCVKRPSGVHRIYMNGQNEPIGQAIGCLMGKLRLKGDYDEKTIIMFITHCSTLHG